MKLKNNAHITGVALAEKDDSAETVETETTSEEEIQTTSEEAETQTTEPEQNENQE